jgi:hypothetical protein
MAVPGSLDVAVTTPRNSKRTDERDGIDSRVYREVGRFVDQEGAVESDNSAMHTAAAAARSGWDGSELMAPRQDHRAMATGPLVRIAAFQPALCPDESPSGTGRPTRTELRGLASQIDREVQNRC